MSGRIRNARALSRKKSLWVSKLRMQLFGSIPSSLYRAFSKLEYAEEFCTGKIRFQTLEYYKNIEDKTRVDMAEGVAELTVNGEALVFDPERKKVFVTEGVESVVAPTFENSHFIYCMSVPKNGLPSPELHKFGKYVVKLTDPINFLIKIANALKNDNTLNFNPPSFEASKVIYDKYGHYETAPGRSKLNRLRWMQKPKEYASECESIFQYRNESEIDG